MAVAAAEALPFRDHTMDGVVCKVVLSETDEARALTEIGRVLAPGGTLRLCVHAVGYYVLYLWHAGDVRAVGYAVRSLVNTWLYVLFRVRLPGFLGDTLYQSRPRLRDHYRRAGLRLIEDAPARTFLGLPVFLYQTVRRV